MKDNNIVSLKTPIENPLEALLKQGWETDYDHWLKRDLSNRCFVYIWADGVYCNVRMGDRLYLLVIMSGLIVIENGGQELSTIKHAYHLVPMLWVCRCAIYRVHFKIHSVLKIKTR